MSRKKYQIIEDGIPAITSCQRTDKHFEKAHLLLKLFLIKLVISIYLIKTVFTFLDLNNYIKIIFYLKYKIIRLFNIYLKI